MENKRVVRIKAPLKVDGKREWVEIVEFDSMIGIRLWEDRFFAHIMQKFISAGYTTQGRIGMRTVICSARAYRFSVSYHC